MNTLEDSFNRKHSYLRISVTDRCNLRCVYCMPHDGIEWKRNEDLLTFEEIVRVARLLVSMGVNKIRITGGEPLIRPNLLSLMSDLSKLDGLTNLAITTNGTLLEDKLVDLKAIGLHSLNISLDSLKRERFLQVTRRDDFGIVYGALQAALKFDFPALKLNVVVMGGFNDDEILDFVDLAYRNRINVRFIEFMPFRDNSWKAQDVVSYAEMRSRIEKKYELIPIETEPSSVGKDFAIAGGIGRVSFVTSMTESFCSSCNRIRLTADGFFKPCLFFPAEMSLRDSMRAGASDDDLSKIILAALASKPEAHPPAEEIAKEENRAMIEIGG
jgi:GTP 3',8-cyclase